MFKKCNSTEHFARLCYDAKDEVEDENALMVITFPFTETVCSAILDSGCTETCCGEGWLEVFLDTLSEEELKQVQYHDDNRRYKFGSVDPISSTKSCNDFVSYRW